MDGTKNLYLTTILEKLLAYYFNGNYTIVKQAIDEHITNSICYRVIEDENDELDDIGCRIDDIIYLQKEETCRIKYIIKIMDHIVQI